MLNTAKVPKDFIPLFEKAQEYVNKYFQTQTKSPSTGSIEIFGERYILIRASSLSVDFFSMVTSLYENDHLKEATKIARQILFDLAHSIGKQDAKEFHHKLNLTNPMEKLSVGPIHFSHTGWAFVDISPESTPSPDDNFFLAYDHIYSFEAEAWIKEGKKSDFCVCVMNAGYSSGWCEESFGIPLVASELICKAKGDEACRFIMAPPSRIEDHISRERAHYKPEQRITNRLPEVPALLQWKQRGDALRESEDKFRSAFEFSAIGMAMVTLDETCLRANNSFCKITGYSDDELKRIPLKEIYHQDDIDANSDQLGSLVEGKIHFYHLEMRFIHKQGNVVWIFLSVSLVRDKKGTPLYFIVQAEDISQRKQAEKNLRKTQTQLMLSEKMAGIGQLAAGVCHEIMNPLNILSIQAQLFKRGKDNDPKLKQTAEKMTNEVKRIQKIVNTLSTFSQQKSTEIKKVQLGLEIESTLSLYKKELENSNIAIVNDFNCELPTLWLDPDELRQVLINLINNARYAMKDGGVLTIYARQHTKDGLPILRIKFSDTGTGIKKELLNKVFDPFFTTKPEGEGTGMGLSIIHTIIHKYEGTVQVESVEGQGTTFIIDLPVKHVESKEL